MLLIDWLSGADVLARKLVDPAYAAVIELLALVRALVVNWAWPVPSRATEPSVVVPFLNATVPVGVPTPDVTVAVNVTGEPYACGLADEVSAVDVAALVTDWVCVVELGR